jgi:quercetin dioxygenase-like cupin family protein
MIRRVISYDEVEPLPTEGQKDYKNLDARFLIGKKTMGTNACMFRCTFTPDGFHAPHSHTGTDEFFYVISCGKALTGIEDDVYVMKPGMCFYFPKNVSHWTKNYDDYINLELVTCYTDKGSIEESGYMYNGEEIPVDAEKKTK